MLILNTLNDAEKFVSRQKKLDNNVWWENYDIVFFREAPQGVYSKDGAFHNGTWGFKNRASVNSEGKWEIDWRNVKRVKPSRNRPR
jgi:hypothetical protein